MVPDIQNNSENELFTFSYSYFVILYYVTIWLALFPSVLFGYWYFTVFHFSLNITYILFLIPLFIAFYGLSLLCSLVSAKVGMWIVHKRITYPKVGSYRLSMDDPQTRAFIIKGTVKGTGRWLYYFFHLKFLQAI